MGWGLQWAWNSILKPNLNQKEVIVRNELIYFWEWHKSEVLYNPYLFKVNGNTHEERLINLCALVAEDDECSLCSLPTNADASLAVKASFSNMHEDKNEKVVIDFRQGGQQIFGNFLQVFWLSSRFFQIFFQVFGSTLFFWSFSLVS